VARINENGTDIQYKRTRKAGVCFALGCSNTPRTRGKLCSKCQHHRHKITNPLKYAYVYHKGNAKARGIPWLLSFNQFKYFWTVLHPDKWEQKRKNIIKPVSSGKMKNRGCNYEIDRVDPTGPYALVWEGKLQVECVSKCVNLDRHYNYLKKENNWTVRVNKPSQEPENKNVPF